MTLMIATTTLSMNIKYPDSNYMDYNTYLDDGEVSFASGSTYMSDLTIDQILSIKARMVHEVRNGRGHIKCERSDNWVKIIHTYKYWVKGL